VLTQNCVRLEPGELTTRECRALRLPSRSRIYPYEELMWFRSEPTVIFELPRSISEALLEVVQELLGDAA